MSEISYWDQIEEAFEKVDIYESYETFKQSASAFPDWKIDLLAVHWTLSEVENGGLEQYFSNSTGILAPEAITAFQRIGKPDLASALQEAAALLGTPFPRDRDERQVRLEKLIGESDSEGESFSLIPAFVAKSVGVDTDENVFQKFDEKFFDAAEDVWKTLDTYAASKVI